MSGRVRRFDQRRPPEPDYSAEVEREELAGRLLDLVPELAAMDPVEAVVEACHRVGFNGFDGATLRLLAWRTGRFPLSIGHKGAVETAKGVPRYTVRLGWAGEALRSSDAENPDFWGDEDLVREAARRAPREWARVDARLERERLRLTRAHLKA